MKHLMISKNKLLTRYYYLNTTFSPIFSCFSTSSKTLNPQFLFPLKSPIFRSKFHTVCYSLCNLPSGSLPKSSTNFPIYRFTSNHQFPYFVRPSCLCRCFCEFPKNGNYGSELSNGFDSNVNHKYISEIVAAVRSGDSDLSSNLSLLGRNLSTRLIVEVFRVLNRERIPALHFFQWVQRRYPELCYNCDVCSLIIDNCGWLEDYGTMLVILKKFRSEQVCLNERAFEFLPVLYSSKVCIMKAVERVIKLLNEVGGSCRGSGICSLIKRFCTLKSFEVAKFVIEISEKDISYYNIIILSRLRRGRSVELHAILDEMRELGCCANVKTYNYLLSNLCKKGRISEAFQVVELMDESGESPDEITFEILILYYCRLGKMDIAHQFVGQMMSRNLRPRLQTHISFVKSYFHAGNYKEAHKYVLNLDKRYLQSINMIYSFLADLHHKKGNLIVARNVLIEMMEKDLKPNFLVYVKIKKGLQKTGNRSLAWDLNIRFSRFTMEVSTTN